jgi:hypothetical protein
MELLSKFFIDLLKRLMADTPIFFKIIRTIGIVAAAVTLIPSWLEAIGVALPDSLHLIANKVIGIAALVSAFVAQLTATEAAKKEKGID